MFLFSFLCLRSIDWFHDGFKSLFFDLLPHLKTFDGVFLTWNTAHYRCFLRVVQCLPEQVGPMSFLEAMFSEFPCLYSCITHHVRNSAVVPNKSKFSIQEDLKQEKGTP